MIQGCSGNEAGQDPSPTRLAREERVGKGPFFVGGGYPLHSPSPYRLWFAFRLPEVRVNYPVMGNRIDGHSLLRQAQEKFASTLGSPAIEPERELIQIVVQVLMTDRKSVV